MVTHPSTILYSLCCLTSNSLHSIILPLSYWYSVVFFMDSIILSIGGSYIPNHKPLCLEALKSLLWVGRVTVLDLAKAQAGQIRMKQPLDLISLVNYEHYLPGACLVVTLHTARVSAREGGDGHDHPAHSHCDVQLSKIFPLSHLSSFIFHLVVRSGRMFPVFHTSPSLISGCSSACSLSSVASSSSSS